MSNSELVPGSGVLAFMYNALYNDEINRRIKESDAELSKVIAEFGLAGTEAERSIRAIVSSKEGSEDLVKQLAEALSDEMNQNPVTLRQHIW